jgi:L-ascorbate metabolism protein UlaG (beta-lactamase superfamily)
VAGAVLWLTVFGTPAPTVGQPPLQPDARGGTNGIFVGNEGVVLMSGRSIVMIDALFRDGVDGYRTVPPNMREKFEGGLPELEGLSFLALASHHHADHFNPEAVVAFLTARSEARFLSTPLAIGGIAALTPSEDVLARATASHPAEGDRETFVFGDVRVRVLNLHHGRARPDIQNLGLLVDVGGVRILHMGDTEVTPQEIIDQDLAAEDLDAAFVPYWLLLEEDGPDVIEAIGARQIFAFHIPVADVSSGWWGDLDSLEGTVAFLNAMDGVTAITDVSIHTLSRPNKPGFILRRKDTWPDTSRTARSSSYGN